MTLQLKKKPPLVYSLFPGYSMALIYGGILGLGNRFVGNSDTLNDLQATLDNMRDWYYEWRIEKHLPAYKRYKL